MKSYFDAKQELDKHKISITEDVPKFAKSVKSIPEYGYEPKKVIAEFEDIRYLAGKREALEIRTDEMHKNLAKLKQQDYSLRHGINLHSANLSIYNDLANVGFGSKELRRLLRTILDITNSNGINHWLAIDKFFNDIETQYDTKLGFESEKESLNFQIQILKEKRENMLQILRAHPLVGNTVMKLLLIGLNENLEPLGYCEKDAKRLSVTLRKHQYKIPPKQRLIGEVGYLVLHDAIKLFFREATPENTLFFYFSGHGVLDKDGKVYIASSDVNPASYEAYLLTSIS